MTTATATAQAPTQEEVMEFVFKMVGELGAALAAAHVYVGDRLGLFRALAAAGPVTAAELAAQSGLQERYVREWTGAMAASGYIDYDATRKTFTLPPAKAAVLVDEDSPAFVGGFAQMIPDHFTHLPRIIDAFKNGGGVPYSDFTNDTFETAGAAPNVSSGPAT